METRWEKSKLPWENTKHILYVKGKCVGVQNSSLQDSQVHSNVEDSKSQDYMNL